MKYNGVIFDLDGVICFTDKYHYKAWKAIADKLGIYFDEKINDRLRGVSRMASLDIILERSPKQYTDREKQSFAEEKNQLYRQLLREMSPGDIADEVRETLSKIREKGIKLAIGSSSKNTPLILEKTDMARYFDAVSDGNNITHSKPDPEVFLKAAEFIGLSPAECIIVEDATAGIDAGAAGGFTTAAIGQAVGYEKADISLSTFSDLLKYI